ncbi:MAG: hypothetical protein HXY40_00270 [Chloroflexi bacterium]|nr:hypothetical protein [Chloroflexota bacterium]
MNGYGKIYEITGTRSFHIAPKVIRDEETYAAYLRRLERKEKSQRHTGSARWQESQMNKLPEVRISGAAQLEIAAALPDRPFLDADAVAHFL